MFTWAKKYAHPKIKVKPLRKEPRRPLPIRYEAERIAQSNPQCALQMFDKGGSK